MKSAKRLLAGFVLVFVMLSGVVLNVPGKSNFTYAAPENTYDKEAVTIEFYRENVNSIFKKYGIFNKEKSEKSGYIENAQSGLMKTYTVDITGDGFDELFLMYIENGNIRMEIYTNKNGKSTKAWSTTAPWGGIFNMAFCKDTVTDSYYWYYGISRGYTYELFTYKNNQYQKVKSDELSMDTVEYDKYNSEATAMHNQMKKHLGISVDDADSETLFKYGGDIVLEAADDYALATGWELINDNSKTNSTDNKNSAANILGGIKYYGDAGKCKMTKEMALAFVDVIEDERNRANSIPSATPFLSVALLDLAGDGMPILLTVIASNADGDVMRDSNDVPYISVWTWNGKNAEKYDFTKDMTLKYIENILFYPNGDNQIRVYEGKVFINIEDSHGILEYKVSNGQIFLNNHETIYVASVDNDDPQGAIGECMPLVRTTPYEDGLLYASVEDLIYAKWIIGENPQSGEHLYMRSINGEFVPFKDFDEVLNKTSKSDPFEGTQYNIIYDYFDEGEDGLRIVEGAMTGHIDATGTLRKYSEVAGKPVYSYNEVSGELADSIVKGIAKKVAEKFDGEVGEIYKLSDDLYYVIIYIDGKVSAAVIVKNTKNGNDWRIVKSYKEVASEDELSKEASKDLQTSNINIDFTKVDEGVNHVKKALGNIDGTCLNPSAKEELTKFIDASIPRCTSGKIKAKNNVVVIGSDSIKKASDSAEKMYEEYNALLDANNITLNKPITIIIQFVVKNADSKKPVQIKLTKDILNSMGSASEINLILEGTACTVRINKDSLEKIIAEHGEIMVILQDKGKDTYIIQFIDSNEKIIQKLCSSIKFSLPADNELCTISAEYTGGTDNWGGQYDDANGSLIFGAHYSGTYTVLNKKIDIEDIKDLTQEEQKAIRFMVSKEFLELDGKSFNPNGTLNRYSFTKALVKMGFDLDKDAETSFEDVKKDNPYYHYVASGETKGIIEGYEDGLFHGDADALREDVIGLCARTLRERKGYKEPENPDEFLHFADKDDIIWAHSIIALAVREGLIDDGGVLNPQSPINRKDAAVILYKLFMLLHEVEPVAVTGVASEDGGGRLWIPIACASAGVAAIGSAAIILIKRKKAAKALAKAAKSAFYKPSSLDKSEILEDVTKNKD